jgi:hypothetical protein
MLMRAFNMLAAMVYPPFSAGRVGVVQEIVDEMWGPKKTLQAR